MLKRENNSKKELFERKAKEMYDKFGLKYQKSREEGFEGRAYNELLELPSMIRAIEEASGFEGKRILDVGCGAGVHAKEYYKRGAEVIGVDISTSMLNKAREDNPQIQFFEASVMNLNEVPELFKGELFDLVTASLCLDYVDDLVSAFKSINKVLKPGGLLIFSDESIFSNAKEKYEDNNIAFRGVGLVVNKKTGKEIFLGRPNETKESSWEVSGVPGMIMHTISRPFRSRLIQLVAANFELIDYHNCKPEPEFEQRNKRKYYTELHLPLFGIYVARKKPNL